MRLMSAINKQIDGQLINIRQTFTEELFVKLEAFLNDLAEYATPVSAIVGALIGFVVAIKTDSLVIFFGAFLWIITLILFHYIGSKLQKSCQSTIDNNPSSVASQDYLDVVSVVNLMGALVALVCGVYFSIKTNYLAPFLVCVCLSLVLLYTIWITLNPRLVSTYVEASSSAGVDAIAILVLTNKIYLRANKVFFGLFPTVGAILLVKALYESFGDPSALLYSGLYGVIGFVLVLVGLISPFLCYLAFIFSYMILDVMRSILALNKKKDVRVDSVPMPVPELTAVPEFAGNISVKMVQRVIVGAIVVFAVVALGIKGKEYYIDYQERAEAKKAADNIKRAEDERIAKEMQEEEDRIAEERLRVKEFVAKARKYVGGSSLDFMLDPDVNQAFREIMKTDERMQFFEGYFSNAGNVSEAAGLIIGQGCKEPCETLKTFVFIDVKTGFVAAAVSTNEQILYFGIKESKAPPLMKKWAMAVRQGLQASSAGALDR